MPDVIVLDTRGCAEGMVAHCWVTSRAKFSTKSGGGGMIGTRVILPLAARSAIHWLCSAY
jgi:hypothetical protein